MSPTETDYIHRLERRLEREKQARQQAEYLLERKSSELMSAVERLEHEVKRGEDLLTAIERTQDGIAICDPDGLFVYMNASHEAMFGYESGELIGKHWNVLYGPAELASLETFMMPMLARDGMWRGEAEGVCKNGDPIVQEILLTILPNNGLICSTRDISHIKSEQRRLQSLSERLQRAERDAALFTLSNLISHDMNNLLFALHGHAALALNEVKTNDRASEIMRQILKSIQQAQSVIDSLQIHRRMEALNKDLVSLTDIVEAAKSVCATLRPAHVELRLQVPQSAMVRSNEPLVFRCVVNLLKNAFEAITGEGEVTVVIDRYEHPNSPHGITVELGRVPAKPGYALRVKDTGVGMTEDQLNQIFDPYFTTKEQYGGTGLGLLTLQMLTEHSDTYIIVESEIEFGTEFTIVFPDI